MKQLHLMEFDDAKDLAWEAAWASNQVFDLVSEYVNKVIPSRMRGWGSEIVKRVELNRNSSVNAFLTLQKVAGLVMGQPENGDPQMCHWSYNPSDISLSGVESYATNNGNVSVGVPVETPDPGWQ